MDSDDESCLLTALLSDSSSIRSLSPQSSQEGIPSVSKHPRACSDSDIIEIDCHKDKRNAPMTMEYTIDGDGDLNMILDGGSIIVSRKALSLSSPVFLAMLGKDSKFQETKNRNYDENDVQIISFPDDNLLAMVTVARIIHLQSDQVPGEVSFQQLYQIAVLCDKYDLKQCLGPWIDIWSKPYLDSYTLEGFQGWLFMSKVFQYRGLFKEMTRHLILNSEVSETGEHVIGKGRGISARVATPIIDQIANARANMLSLVLDLYWQELCKLRASGTIRVCTVGGANGTKCDAINLGCLYQKFPNLQDPRIDKGKCRTSVNSMTAAPGNIPDVCGALLRQFREHSPCAVGARLARQATELVKSVTGLELGT